ncbi:polygalacturonase-like [Zingiber officinale]|uniref:polygalacturonase-like n=1 Tax=Zingiber officinale TaxID=94328 RepID=UPI001C4B0DF3|nr:polygalacturonase-like [Zingiber officinale]
MDTLQHRHRRLSTVLAFLVLAAALGVALAGILEEAGEPVRVWNRELISEARRRLLIGPGSWPPNCRARCGRCRPCVTVHVAIQPGRTMPLEYYPEAWRCECGNKLFTP